MAGLLVFVLRCLTKTDKGEDQMEPKCPHCGSSEYTGTKRTRGGVKLVLVVCSSCGAILGAVNDTK